jgi:hypothetical protein
MVTLNKKSLTENIGSRENREVVGKECSCDCIETPPPPCKCDCIETPVPPCSCDENGTDQQKKPLKGDKDSPITFFKIAEKRK